MEQKNVKYSYCYLENNNDDKTLCLHTYNICKLPKIDMKLPHISLKFCENLNLILV